MVQLVTVLFLTSLISVGSASYGASLSSVACEHDTTTAKALLSAIYSGEKAYHAEYKTYSDNFGEIGIDPNIETIDDTNCDTANWSFEINSIEGPDQFKATAFSRVTREEYTINEKKEIRKVGLEVSSVPVEE